MQGIIIRPLPLALKIADRSRIVLIIVGLLCSHSSPHCHCKKERQYMYVQADSGHLCEVCTTFSCSGVWILCWFLICGLHTTTSLSWLAIRRCVLTASNKRILYCIVLYCIRAVIVSLRSSAPKLDVVTKRVI